LGNKSKNYTKRREAFSVLELVFVIVILAIIASIAIPKLVLTKNDALIASIKSDIKTSANIIPSYYLVKGSITDIKDAISFDMTRWSRVQNINKNDNLAFLFKTPDNNIECSRVEIDDTNGTIFRVLITDTTTNSSNFCNKLRESYGVLDNNITINTPIGSYFEIINIKLD
jgi:general secretion pathway protein G